MLLFRSEEHVDRWNEARGLPRGGLLSLEQVWRLADAWYRHRMEPGWRRRTPDEANALFADVGLSGSFWKL